VNNETKLYDAFQKAVFNGESKVERYTTIMSKELNFLLLLLKIMKYLIITKRCFY